MHFPKNAHLKSVLADWEQEERKRCVHKALHSHVQSWLQNRSPPLRYTHFQYFELIGKKRRFFTGEICSLRWYLLQGCAAPQRLHYRWRMGCFQSWGWDSPCVYSLLFSFWEWTKWGPRPAVPRYQQPLLATGAVTGATRKNKNILITYYIWQSFVQASHVRLLLFHVLNCSSVNCLHVWTQITGLCIMGICENIL